MYVECERKTDTINNSGDWNHFKFSQTVPKHHIRKAQNSGIAINSHVGNCTQTAGSSDVTVQNKFQGEIILHVAQIVNREQLQHYIPYKHILFQV